MTVVEFRGSVYRVVFIIVFNLEEEVILLGDLRGCYGLGWNRGFFLEVLSL